MVVHFLFLSLQLECALRGTNTGLLELSSNRKWFWCEKKHFQSNYFIRHIVVAAFSVRSPRIIYGLIVTKCGNKGMIYKSRRHEFGMRILKCLRIEQQ